MNFKQTVRILLLILTVNLAIAQDKTKHNYEICNSLFSLELKKNFDKNFNDSFILKKELSYAYYIDSKTMQNVKLEFKNSNLIDCVPYQYVLKYQLVDDEFNIIHSFNINFLYRNGLLELERLGNFKDFFTPYSLVVEKKLINVSRAKQIAKDNGFNSTSYELDYEKKEGTNEYKNFKPKIIWSFKELVKNEKENYYKVILINAKNGRVLKKYEEFQM